MWIFRKPTSPICTNWFGDALEHETVADNSQACGSKTIEQLLRYWQSDYELGAKWTATPCSFITEIDGLDIHFIHVRSKHECIADDRDPRLARLDHRATEDCRAAHQPHGAWRERVDAFGLVIPSMPGPRLFRQTDHGWDVAHMARAWVVDASA